MPTPTPLKKIAIAGARGFVGKHLARRLASEHYIVGLSRSAGEGKPGDGVHEWRSCDLYSLRESLAALEGIHTAYYLVHSMLPSAMLMQASFDDLDLIAADNFARAAQTHGVKQIIYLGGIVPAGRTDLSEHLASRLEVEKTLGAYGVPVTKLRASLLIGADGSSFQMMLRLVKRLPVMLCPRWTETRTQPIALEDAIECLAYCLGEVSTQGRAYDIAGPNVLTYREMIQGLAEKMSLERKLIPVPAFSPGLSTFWVHLVTGAPIALVKPLVQSLLHEMVADDDELIRKAGIHAKTFAESIDIALKEEASKPKEDPTAYRQAPHARKPQDVRSVQRLPLPTGKTADWVAHEYLRWLPRLFPPFLNVETNEAGQCTFWLRPFWRPLLSLDYGPDLSSPDRALFRIRGGVLARLQGRGRLEFRQPRGSSFVLAAVHDYRPRLPWFLYRWTQAKIHLLVMRFFGRYLRRERFAPPAKPLVKA